MGKPVHQGFCQHLFRKEFCLFGEFQVSCYQDTSPSITGGQYMKELFGLVPGKGQIGQLIQYQKVHLFKFPVQLLKSM